jgi:hypothetical protein
VKPGPGTTGDDSEDPRRAASAGWPR